MNAKSISAVTVDAKRNRLGLKITLSKWTAVRPQNQEKHFLGKTAGRSETGRRTYVLEAVLTRRHYIVDSNDLHDPERWLSGWR